MTLDNAIQHVRKIAEQCMAHGEYTECYQCGKEHEQIADWLTELKQRREREETAKKLKTNGDKIRSMTDDELFVFLNEITGL